MFVPPDFPAGADIRLNYVPWRICTKEEEYKRLLVFSIQ
jgi:hypothetical protein